MKRNLLAACVTVLLILGQIPLRADSVTSGAVTSAVVALVITDTTLPTISCSGHIITNSTGGSKVVEWGTTVSDNCGITNLACVPPSGSAFPVGTNPVTCTAWDGSGNTSHCNFTVTVLQTAVAGQVTLELYAGLAGDGNGSRDVTFSASAPGTFTNRTTQLLHFIGGVSGYSLNVPLGTVNVSAKTAWSLRQTKTVSFTPGPTTANFLLPAGDINGSNLVDIDDYFQLAVDWYTTDAASDIDGDGLVDIEDYFLLASRWYEAGDGE